MRHHAKFLSDPSKLQWKTNTKLYEVYRIAPIQFKSLQLFETFLRYQLIDANVISLLGVMGCNL